MSCVVLTKYNRDDGDTETNKEVGDNVATLVCASDRHRGHCSDVIEATVDDKRGADNPNGRCDSPTSG